MKSCGDHPETLERSGKIIFALLLAGGVSHDVDAAIRTLTAADVFVAGERVAVRLTVPSGDASDLQPALSICAPVAVEYRFDLRIQASHWLDRAVDSAVITNTAECLSGPGERFHLTRRVGLRTVDSVKGDRAQAIEYLTAVPAQDLFHRAVLERQRRYVVTVSATVDRGPTLSRIAHPKVAETLLVLP